MNKEILEYAKTRADSVKVSGEGLVLRTKCWRCSNGTYRWGPNGCYAGDCFRCFGTGWDKPKVIKNAERWYKARLRADKKNAEKDAARAAEAAARRKAELPELWVKAILAIRLKDWKDEALARRKAASNWVGKVGEKVKGLKLEVVFRKSINTYYGTSSLIILKDAEGNKFKSFYSGRDEVFWGTRKVFEDGEGWLHFAEGEPSKGGYSVIVSGTIKAHEEYEGEKSTVLTRIKSEELA